MKKKKNYQLSPTSSGSTRDLLHPAEVNGFLLHEAWAALAPRVSCLLIMTRSHLENRA